MEFNELLIEITGGQKPIACMKEIAFQMGVSLQTAYDYRLGRTEPTWSSVVRLSRYLITEYGYYHLAMQPAVSVLGGKANGKVNDELLKLYESGTDLHRAFSDKDRAGCSNALAKMKAEYNTLLKEVEAL